MAAITIKDGKTGAELNLIDTSWLAKSGLKDLSAGHDTFVSEFNHPLDRTQFNSAALEATFKQPKITLPGGLGLTLKGGGNAVLSLLRKKDSPLLGDDPADPEIAIGDNQYWLSFELDTTLDVTAAAKYSGFGLKIHGSTAAKLSAYTLFDQQSGPLPDLQTAAAGALSNFSTLSSAAALRDQRTGTVVVCEASGTFEVSGSYELPLAVNQLSLAEAEIPFKVSVAPSATLKAGGAVSVTGDYLVRCWRRSGSELIIGIYKKRGTELSVSFQAGAGLEANAGDLDLIQAFFSAVAPQVNLSATGLTAADPAYAPLAKALNDSIDRSLSISMNASCAATFSHEAAFVYAVGLTTNQAETDLAIDLALGGDWTKLANLPNVRAVKDIVRTRREQKATFVVHLLGIYSYASVADFISSSTVLHSREDGAVTLTDKATATRIAVASTPYVADSDRLRKALYEATVATACYQAVNSKLAPPAGLDLSTSQTLSLYENKMDRAGLKKQLLLAPAVGVMTHAEWSAIPIHNSQPRHVLIQAKQTIDAARALAMFFSAGTAPAPRDLGELVRLGRQTLAALLDPSDPVDMRRIRFLFSDAEWNSLDQENRRPPDSPASYSDWYDVTFWANAVHGAGPRLKEVLDAIRHMPAGTDPSQDPDFMKKRKALASALASFARNTHAAFDKGWPIAVMHALAGGNTTLTFAAAWDGKQQIPSTRPLSSSSVAGGTSPV